MRLSSALYMLAIVGAMVKVVRYAYYNFRASVSRKMFIDGLVVNGSGEYMVGYRCTSVVFTENGLAFSYYWYLWSETGSMNRFVAVGNMNLIKTTIPGIAEKLKVMRRDKDSVVGIMASTPDIVNPDIRDKLCDVSNLLLACKAKKR